LGQACLRAKSQLHAQFPNDTADYRGFNLFGDPTLDVWTGVPRILSVEHPTEIEPVPQQLHVVVTSPTGPEDSAMVCASMDSTVYAYGFTDSSGAIDLSVSPPHTGSLRLVVTGHNLYPCDTTIAVTNVGIGERAWLPLPGPVGLTATPVVFSRATRLSWNPDHAGAVVRAFDAAGRTVATLGAAGSEVVWDAAGEQTGAYVCVLFDRQGRMLASAKALKLD
jgi:hypothetical protein